MERFSKDTLETAKKLRLIDDALFRLVGTRTEVCQEILRTLLDDKELVVLQATPQERITSLHREITLDVLCRLGDGKIINIEVQKGEQNDDEKRCRFHLASITANKTPKGTEFKDVPDVSIVYITEYDALGNGQSVTCSEMCQMVDNNYVPVNDGARIYYANTVVKDNTDKSELLELFLMQDSFDNSKFPNLSQAIKYFKEDEKGVSEVCTLVENYAKNYAKEQMIEVAKSMIEEGMSNDVIQRITHFTEEEIENFRD